MTTSLSILLSLVLAVIAVLLGVPAPPRRRVRGRLAALDPASGQDRQRRRARQVLAGLVVAVGLAATCVVCGARVGVGSLAGVIVLASGYRLVRLERADRLRVRRQVEVAHGCELIAAQLRVGQVPADAVQSAAEDCTLLRTGARLLALGGDPTSVWRQDSERPGCRGLADLATGWQVSYQTGSPLAPLLERVSDALAADVSLRRTIAGEVAAPRATAKIMAVLPALGIGLGYLIGGRPLSFLLHGPPGWTCLLLGCLLAAGGVSWMEHLARTVAEEAA